MTPADFKARLQQKFPGWMDFDASRHTSLRSKNPALVAPQIALVKGENELLSFLRRTSSRLLVNDL